MAGCRARTASRESPTAAAQPVATAPAATTPAPAPAASEKAQPTLHYLNFAADGIEQPVYIDGKKVGVTPLRAYPLAEGSYYVQIGAAATTLAVGPNTQGTYRYNSAKKKWEWL